MNWPQTPLSLNVFKSVSNINFILVHPYKKLIEMSNKTQQLVINIKLRFRVWLRYR